jgi:hypothetical protein
MRRRTRKLESGYLLQHMAGDAAHAKGVGNWEQEE